MVRFDPPEEIIVGISGASGMIYAKKFLEWFVYPHCVESLHIVITNPAKEVIKREIGDLPSFSKWNVYDINDIMAPIASGSFEADAMVVIPCSMKTMSGIANGYTDNLLLRAADVTIKENRPLILVPRETPLSQIHLRNMLDMALLGAVVLPAMPAFYHKPGTIDDLVNYVVSRVLDQLNIPNELYKRWKS